MTRHSHLLPGEPRLSKYYEVASINPAYYLRFRPIKRYTIDITRFSAYFFCLSFKTCSGKPIWEKSNCRVNVKSLLYEYMEKIHTNWNELHQKLSRNDDRCCQKKRLLQEVDERVVIWSYLVSVSNLQYNSHRVPSKSCQHMVIQALSMGGILTFGYVPQNPLGNLPNFEGVFVFPASG